jgi:hypothetical protein
MRGGNLAHLSPGRAALFGAEEDVRAASRSAPPPPAAARAAVPARAPLRAMKCRPASRPSWQGRTERPVAKGAM